MSPTEHDRRIQSKLGDFSELKRLIDEGNAATILIAPVRPPPSSSQPYPQNSSSSSTNRSSSSHPYNQQQQQQSQPQQQHSTQSSAFGKPNENKLPYNGRYSGHPPGKHDVS